MRKPSIERPPIPRTTQIHEIPAIHPEIKPIRCPRIANLHPPSIKTPATMPALQQPSDAISIGSVSASLVHPREVYLPAIKLASTSLILAHNHPSGDASPSKDDLELTRRLKKAGELLGIEVLDHLIITADSHVSLKEQGIL